MASGIFGISVMGLSAAQANIATTNQNIANVNTAGYHRQTTLLSTANPQSTGYGVVGNGVDVTSVARAYNSFLDNQVTLNQGQLSSYEAYTQYASQLDSLLGSQDSAFSASLADFFSSIQDVANDPTSTVARQSMLSAGTNLAIQFNNASAGIDDINQSINQQVQSIAGQVTTLARSVATLNTQIAAAQGTGSGDVNSLLDQRDALVGELNKLVNVTVVNQEGSGYNLYVGNGIPLVIGGQANAMTTVADSADPSQTLPALQIGAGTIPLDSSQITGGQLGGLLSFRNQMLLPTRSDLAQLSVQLTSAVNTQSNAGFDLNGVAGVDFFTTPTVIIPTTAPSSLGASVSLSDPNLLANSDYRLSFDGTNYTLTQLSDNTVVATGASASAVGASVGLGISLTGAMASGDSFVIKTTEMSASTFSVAISDPSLIAAAGPSATNPAVSAGPGDNSNALLLADLQSQKLLGNGADTLQSAFVATVGRNASLESAATTNQQAYQALTDQATKAQQSYSGVNLDEEAANLIKYQQAYQAAAKALQVSSSLFNTMLNALQ